MSKSLGAQGPAQEAPLQNADARLGLGAPLLQPHKARILEALTQLVRMARTESVENPRRAQPARVGLAGKAPVCRHHPHRP